METQVVIAKLMATIFVQAETPEAARAYVDQKFADIEAELAGVQVRLGFQEEGASMAFTEGTDPPGDEDD